ncbi:MAG: metal-dependent transcriptional regulator [Nitrososphaerota archaeon]|nr:metal-dependent transcriptional regulator [Nitrososphaerota archaeon]
MIEKVTEITEEYLECIYKLQEREGVARTSSIVKSLKVAPGTVTNTVERLEREGLVKHFSYKGVSLTDKGRIIALNVIRKHRLSERLLTDILKMSWSSVHEDACMLEHSLSEDATTHLERVLNYPKTCPHGNPIPNRHGRILEEKTLSLVELAVGKQGIVSKLVEEDSETLAYFWSLGIVPGRLIEVLEKPKPDDLIKIRIGKDSHVVSNRLASIIRIREF